MVFIVSETHYSTPNDMTSAIIAEEHFNSFRLNLSNFQKYSILGLIDKKNVLITAHTGSGKTLPAEFAIKYFCSEEKETFGTKVIYCSPIKALSNQKFYDFTNKYPDISFGLLTGDNKINPNAQVLIMTTEILLISLAAGGATDNFDINNVRCVVFDEVHYINDYSRGHVWEKTIMLLPKHIQLLMLSATIDNPFEFAKWVEKVQNRTVWICGTRARAVPLTHYCFLTTTETYFKKTKNKKEIEETRNIINKLHVIQNATGQFNDNTYYAIEKALTRIHQANNGQLKQKFIINKLLDFLKQEDILPAIIFLFSRKQVESLARDITTILLPDDSKVPYIARRECEKLLRDKIPNYEEYFHLPEYEFVISLLEKGIGIHHAGMIPILREIVEMFISKKMIKLLIATETFAIGLDCPIKATIFPQLTKFDGKEQRLLMPHEYTQMAGRAGRRGIDTVGYVIHCPNLCFNTKKDFQIMLSGHSQKFKSKFKISPAFVLTGLMAPASATTNEPPTKTIDEMLEYVNKSMLGQEYYASEKVQMDVIQKLTNKLQEFYSDNILYVKTPLSICNQYSCLKKKTKDGLALSKQLLKQNEETAEKLKDEHKNLVIDSQNYQIYFDLETEREKEINYLYDIQNQLKNELKVVVDFLKKNNLVAVENKSSTDNEETIRLTMRGLIAAHLREIDPIVFSYLLTTNNFLEGISAQNICGIISCFIEFRNDSSFENNAMTTNDNGFAQTGANSDVSDFINKAVVYKNNLLDDDNAATVDCFLDETTKIDIHTNLLGPIMAWCAATNEEECKIVLQNIAALNISSGDFIKIILKIVAVKKELEYIVKFTSSVPTELELSRIDNLLLKFIATNQSIYL